MLDGVPVSVAVADGRAEEDAAELPLGVANAVRERGAEAEGVGVVGGENEPNGDCEGLPSGVTVRLPVRSALPLPQTLVQELGE